MLIYISFRILQTKIFAMKYLYCHYAIETIPWIAELMLDPFDPCDIEHEKLSLLLHLPTRDMFSMGRTISPLVCVHLAILYIYVRIYIYIYIYICML